MPSEALPVLATLIETFSAVSTAIENLAKSVSAEELDALLKRKKTQWEIATTAIDVVERRQRAELADIDPS